MRLNLIGARKFNELEGNKALTTLYGCSTTGVEWRFLKYENNIITIDENRYLLTELSKIIGILGYASIGLPTKSWASTESQRVMLLLGFFFYD